MGKNINYNYYCFNNNLHTPYKMNLNYNTEKKVKPILRFLKKEGLLRSNWLAGESSTFVFGESTWSEKKRNKVKNNYIKRIPEGKVPVFYLDLVEHVIKELNEDLKGHSGFFASAAIHDTNRCYRLVAYYEALLELNINHRS